MTSTSHTQYGELRRVPEKHQLWPHDVLLHASSQRKLPGMGMRLGACRGRDVLSAHPFENITFAVSTWNCVVSTNTTKTNSTRPKMPDFFRELSPIQPKTGRIGVFNR